MFEIELIKSALMKTEGSGCEGQNLDKYGTRNYKMKIFNCYIITLKSKSMVFDVICYYILKDLRR